MNEREHNKSYFGLDDAQYDRWLELMAMNMMEWPRELYDYCRRQSQVYGFCGDSIASWVAEWVKGQA